MKIIKKLSPFIIPHIMHLIDRVIYTGIYPECLKNSKITPTIQSDKPYDKIDSYWPLDNLNSIHKLIQQHINTELINYLDTNTIILELHLIM